MSNDPKDKPLDATPGETPELLQRELSLDRRHRQDDDATRPIPAQPQRPARQAPPNPAVWSQQQQQQARHPHARPQTQTQPQAQAPTEPNRPQQARPQAPLPSGLVVTPQTLEQRAPTLPRPQPPPQAAPRAAVPPPARAPVPAPQARAAASPPPSVMEQLAKLPTVHESEADELPTILVAPGTAPGAPVATGRPASKAPVRAPQPQRPLPDPAHREPAPVLPAHMLVTQPGMAAPPGTVRRGSSPSRPPVRAEASRAEPVEAPPSAAVPARAPRAPSGRVPRAEPVRAEETVLATPASLFRRVGAWVIDLSLIGGISGGFLFAAMTVIAPKNAGLVKSLTAIALPGLFLAGLLAFVYTTLFAFFFHGRTPGRKLFGIQLVDGGGDAPGPARALLRAGLALVSFGLFLAGFWLALFDRHGQTLHDKLTGTFVVRLVDA